MNTTNHSFITSRLVDIHAQDWYLYPDEKLVMDIDNDKLLTHEEQENLGWHKE